MEDLTLPPVAKSIFYFCKKCDAERYHTVLAHVSSLSAKIACEVCKSKKTYKVGEPKKGRKVTAAAKKKAASIASHEQAYNDNHKKIGLNGIQKYSMKAKYDSNTAIEHPKFGVGFITSVASDKIAVCFQDSERMLVHNRN